jgi:hypothetical protein
MSRAGAIHSLIVADIVLIGIASLLSACSNDASVPAAAPAAVTTAAPTAPSAAPATVATAAPSQDTTATAGVQELVLQGTPPTSVVANTQYFFQPHASVQSTSLNYFISGKPQWAKFDASTGALSGMPGTANEGYTGHIIISARTDTNTASLAPFVVNVSAPQTKSGTATVTWTAPTENADGSPIRNLAGYYIIYGTDPSALTTTVTVNNAGATRYVLSGLAPGSYYVAVVAFNAAGVISEESNVSDGMVET